MKVKKSAFSLAMVSEGALTFTNVSGHKKTLNHGFALCRWETPATMCEASHLFFGFPVHILEDQNLFQ